MSRVTSYAAMAIVDDNDLLPIVDVSDTSMSSSGTTKNIAVKNLLGLQPTNTSADIANIQGLLNLAGPGKDVKLAPGAFLCDGATPISIPSGVGLEMSNGDRRDPLTGAVLKLAATYTGASVISFPTGSSEQKLRRVSIDGSLAPANTVIGIDGTGIQQLMMQDCCVYGAGISTGVKGYKNTGTNANALGWRVDGFTVSNVSGIGLDLSSATDGNWAKVQAIACTLGGMRVQGCQNTRFNGMQFDFNGAYGLLIAGSGWGTGAGSGGAIFSTISTDRNAQSGISVTSTGNGPIQFNGLMLRRDGSSSTSSNYAGLKINGATTPVVVDGICVYPGINDDGTGSQSPQFGVDIRGASTAVTIGGAGYVQGVSAAINDDLSSTYVYVSPSVITAVGPSTAPVLDGAASAAITSEVDVTNTVTETTIISLTLPNGILKAGSAWRISIRGTLQVVATSGTLTFTPYLGPNAAPQAPQMASQSGASGPNTFNLDITLTVRSTGATGSFIAGGNGRIDFATGVIFGNTGSLGTAVVDTTQAGIVLKLTAAWATADAANVLKVTEAVINQIVRPNK